MSCPLLAHDLALAFLQVGGDGVAAALRVVDGEVGQLDPQRELVLLVVARRGLDEADVVEAHLALVHGALVEDFGRDVLRREVDALLLRLVQHGGEQAHLELEGQHVHARRAALAAFGDDFLDEQPPDGQVDRADHDQPPARSCRGRSLAAGQRLGAL